MEPTPDPSLPLRRAVVATLRADGPFTALVAAPRVYGRRSPAQPTFPFTRYTAPDTEAFRAQCLDGARIPFSINGFSKQEYEDEASDIASAAKLALDGKVLALPGGMKAHIHWAGSRMLEDPLEASVWHGIARFEATITA